MAGVSPSSEGSTGSRGSMSSMGLTSLIPATHLPPWNLGLTGQHKIAQANGPGVASFDALRPERTPQEGRGCDEYPG
jgi:hypothetical protein